MNFIRNLARYFYLISHDNLFFGLIFDLLYPLYYAEKLKFYIPRHLSTPSFRTRFFFDTYEKHERILVRKFIKPAHVVLELGGGLGVVSCVTNAILKNKKKHVVVEANPQLVPIIRKNRQLNKCDFFIENSLISKRKRNIFYIHKLFVGGSTERKTDQEIKVPEMTLVQLEQKYNIRFTALIIDIEGGEYIFLEENQNFLNQLTVVIIELHDFILTKSKIQRCRSLLANSGLVLATSRGISEVWVRDSHHNELL